MLHMAHTNEQAHTHHHIPQTLPNPPYLVLQTWVLKMLAEFVLLYSSCVGVLLRRDTEGASGGGPHTRGTPHHHHHHRGHEGDAGQLICYLMHIHLPYPPTPIWGMQALDEAAAFLLLSVCIRWVVLMKWVLVM